MPDCGYPSTNFGTPAFSAFKVLVLLRKTKTRQMVES
jgi:hypothetical protein